MLHFYFPFPLLSVSFFIRWAGTVWTTGCSHEEYTELVLQRALILTLYPFAKSNYLYVITLCPYLRSLPKWVISPSNYLCISISGLKLKYVLFITSMENSKIWRSNNAVCYLILMLLEKFFMLPDSFRHLSRRSCVFMCWILQYLSCAFNNMSHYSTPEMWKMQKSHVRAKRCNKKKKK